MVRRYRRDRIDTLPRFDVPFRDFPSGSGGQLCLGTGEGEWRRLGIGEGAVVPLGSEGGAFAWGLGVSRAVIWVAPDLETPAAYCLHAPMGPLGPGVWNTALRLLECPLAAVGRLHVFVATPQIVAVADEQFLVRGGVPPAQVVSYSGCLVPQFGVSAAGCVGEVA